MKIINFQPQNTKVLAASTTALKNQAVAYYSGKIYCFGGETSGGTVSASSFSYDIATDTWASITALPASASGAQCWVFGTLIYIQGGKAASGSNPRTALYSYNPSTNAYTTLTAGTGAWSAACGVYTSGSTNYLYAFGGFSNNSGTNKLTSIRRYNIGTNAWSTMTPTISTGSEANITSFTHDNKQYFLYPDYAMNFYDYALDGISSYPTYEHSGKIVGRNNAAVIGNRIFMHGTSALSTVPSTEIMDFTNNASSRGLIPATRPINKFMFDCQLNSLVTDGTKVYAVTGSNPNGTVETRVIEYTPHTQGSTWTTTTTTLTDFSSGNDFASNGWTVVNGTQTNKWQVGTAGGTGTTGNSAYISNDGGTTKGYTLTATSVVHFYKDIDLTDGGSAYDLQMFMKVDGEEFAGVLYDAIEVYSCPTTFTPTAGTKVSTNGYLLRRQYSLAGGTYYFDLSYWKGTTRRFVITWYNDSSTGNSTGGASIDDIKLNKHDLS